MKKKFVAKRCNFYIRCIKTTVNDGKFKQDKNLQKPLRTRAKNKRGARKYPLRVNTLHHPNSFNSIMMASFLPVIVSKKNKQTKKNMPFITVSHKFT